jgi:Uma2 family endonuclease
MVVVANERMSLSIPQGIDSLAAFRRWVHGDDYAIPEHIPVHFLNGQVWIDDSMEEFFSHGRVKFALGLLFGQIEHDFEGTFSGDGTRYSNLPTGLSTEPDGLFFLQSTFDRGEIKLIAGSHGQATEVIGRPDLVVEIVSRTSREKDVDWLMGNYFEAGIPEYWLIDARDGAIAFDIHKAGARGYVASKRSAGWVKSPLFGKSFRLTATKNRAGMDSYRFDVR